MQGAFLCFRFRRRFVSSLFNSEQRRADESDAGSSFFHGQQLFLLDEPTNHLDAEAREQLREYLKSKKGFILVSHDRDLLDACVDHVLVINKTNIEVCKGNFSTWWENKKRQDAYEASEQARLKRIFTG